MKSSFRNITFSKFTLYVLLIAMVWSFLSLKRWEKAETEQKLIDWDITSYYSYLPALFIYNDVSLEFTKRGADVSFEKNHQFWYQTASNGRRIIKVTMGMSILYAPFFFIAHASSSLLGYEPNGFSIPYEFFLAISSIFYLFIGLIYLRKTLLLFFDERVTGVTLLCILLGTNLYYYTTTEPAMSHAYSFAMIAIFVFQTIKWHSDPDLKRTVFIGILFGLIVLIRPVNIIIFLFPLLYNVWSKNTFIDKIKFFIRRKKHILLMAVATFSILLPQLIYWKYLTGQWFFNSYVGEQFYFNNPHVLQGLFSFRNGWLIYSPIMIFSLIGIFFLLKRKKQFFAPLSIFTLLNIFICYSWWAWWYGGSFGSRPMVDSYALIAIPMAVFFEYILSKAKAIQICLFTILTLLIALNIFQTYQRRIGLIHWDSMTFKAYQAVFLKSNFTNENLIEFENALYHPDYEKARKGEED